MGNENQEKQKSIARNALEFGVVILVAVIAALVIRNYVAQLFIVRGESMEPTFQSGDLAVASLLSYRNDEPKDGDVVIANADALGKKVIKRVVGVAGDVVEVKDGTLYRNGKAVEEDYLGEEMEGYFAPVEVPEGYVYLMGDNRNHSTDGRHIGPVPLEDVIGKVVFEVWNNPFKRY